MLIFRYICVFENLVYVSLRICQIFDCLVDLVDKKMREFFYALNCVLTVCVKFICDRDFAEFSITLLSFQSHITLYHLCSFRFLHFKFCMTYDLHNTKHMMQSRSLSLNRMQHLCRIQRNLLFEESFQLS